MERVRWMFNVYFLSDPAVTTRVPVQVSCIVLVNRTLCVCVCLCVCMCVCVCVCVCEDRERERKREEREMYALLQHLN